LLFPDLNDATFFVQGLAQSRLGDYAEAIASLDQALQLNPDDADGHRCVARHRTGDQLGAIADCQTAAALYLKQGRTGEHDYALTMLSNLQA
jgi:Flp pilus assembly protein TadD